MQGVVAKFICDSVTDFGSRREITLSAAVQGDANKTWSKWTPSGSIKMTVTNPTAYEQFVPGREYYLTLKGIEPAQAVA